MRKRLTFLIYSLLYSLLSFGQLAHTNNNNVSTRHGEVLEFEDQHNLSSARYGFGYENDANFIYVNSGVSSENELKSILERYNVETDEWELLTKKVPALKYSTLSLSDQKLYIFGGVNKNHKLNDKVLIYDLKAKTLSKGMTSSTPTYHTGSAVWGGQIYVFGGAFDKTFYSKNLMCYNPKSDSWKKLANMPDEKSTKGEIIDGKLYTIGGYNGKKASNSVDVYDISSNKWSHVFDLPVAVSAHATTVIDGRIWIVGNYNEESYLASIDPINKIYIEYNSNMKVNRHGGCAYINNELFIFGGIKSEQGPALDSVQKLEM